VGRPDSLALSSSSSSWSVSVLMAYAEHAQPRKLAYSSVGEVQARIDCPVQSGLRGVGARWTRILWCCWTGHATYDPAQNLKTQPAIPA